MFHYTVLNLFIHHFSIQNPFSRNIDAPTELESSAGGEKRWKKKQTTKSLKKKKTKKHYKQGGKKKFIFYKKKKLFFDVTTMIVISYLYMYIYTYTYIYVYKSMYFLAMSMKRWGEFVVPRSPSLDNKQAGCPNLNSGPKFLPLWISQSWPIAVFLTCRLRPTCWHCSV